MPVSFTVPPFTLPILRVTELLCLSLLLFLLLFLLFLLLSLLLLHTLLDVAEN